MSNSVAHSHILVAECEHLVAVWSPDMHAYMYVCICICMYVRIYIHAAPFSIYLTHAPIFQSIDASAVVDVVDATESESKPTPLNNLLILLMSEHRCPNIKHQVWISVNHPQGRNSWYTNAEDTCENGYIDWTKVFKSRVTLWYLIPASYYQHTLVRTAHKKTLIVEY